MRIVKTSFKSANVKDTMRRLGWLRYSQVSQRLRREVHCVQGSCSELLSSIGSPCRSAVGTMRQALPNAVDDTTWDDWFKTKFPLGKEVIAEE